MEGGGERLKSKEDSLESIGTFQIATRRKKSRPFRLSFDFAKQQQQQRKKRRALIRFS
jgi:hypothetical protein